MAGTPAIRRLAAAGKNAATLVANKAMTTNSNTTGTGHSAPSPGIVAWRRSQLLSAGFDAWTADAFARTESVDLHALIELVDRGCPPELAARIMAPIDFEVLDR